jgi:hypothetical protein
MPGYPDVVWTWRDAHNFGLRSRRRLQNNDFSRSRRGHDRRTGGFVDDFPASITTCGDQRRYSRCEYQLIDFHKFPPLRKVRAKSENQIGGMWMFSEQKT